MGVDRGTLTKAYADNSKIGATGDRQETDQELWQQLRGGNLLYRGEIGGVVKGRYAGTINVTKYS